MNDKLGLVYIITNIRNNRVYVGQTIDLKRRKYEHLSQLRKGSHKNTELQNDYNKYGESCFQFSVIISGLIRPCRLKVETFLINMYGGIESPNVYNYQDNVTENKEMRYRVSKGQQGKIVNPESVMKMRKSLTGRHLSETHKEHIRQSAKKFCGDANPAKRPEVRQKISEKVSGSGNGMYGKHHSEEAKEKIRKSRLGKSPANKGKNITEATRQKISEGVKRSYQLGKHKKPTRQPKYSQQFIHQLRCEYNVLKNYRAVQRLHPEICYDVIISLIKFGNTRKRNDYQ